AICPMERPPLSQRKREARASMLSVQISHSAWIKVFLFSEGIKKQIPWSENLKILKNFLG
ncbi:MAG: hypothetical protein J6Q00_04890, partial [Verrucomicrobia bacterium]|nr:hypothetical protein [Verrucomicrobiota bacterium]